MQSARVTEKEENKKTRASKQDENSREKGRFSETLVESGLVVRGPEKENRGRQRQRRAHRRQTDTQTHRQKDMERFRGREEIEKKRGKIKK